MPRKGAHKLFLKEEHKLCKDPPLYIWKIIFRKQDKQGLVKSKYSTNVIISITFSKHLSKYFPVVHKPKLRRKSEKSRRQWCAKPKARQTMNWTRKQLFPVIQISFPWCQLEARFLNEGSKYINTENWISFAKPWVTLMY